MGRNVPEWDWWRPKGTSWRSHQYRASFAGRPNTPARCGHSEPEPPDAWEHYTDVQCTKCLKLEEGLERTEAARNRRHED